MPKGSHFKWTHNSIFSPCISNFYVESNFSLFACVRWRGRSWNVNEVCFLIYCLNWDYFCNSRYRAKYLLEQCTSAYNNLCRHSLHYLFNLPIGKKQILPWDIPEPPSIKLPAAKIMTPFLDLQPATSELNIPPKNPTHWICVHRGSCVHFTDIPHHSSHHPHHSAQGHQAQLLHDACMFFISHLTERQYSHTPTHTLY